MANRHDHLIETLFKTDDDRALARAFVARFEAEPMLADRIDPLLREAARTAQRADGGELSPEDARAYLSSFATEGLGTPAHMVTSAMDWLGAGGKDPGEVDVSGLSPEAQQLIAQHDRTKAREDVARFEKMMRENPNEYWRPENQQAYRQALERSLPQAPEPASQESTPTEKVRAALLGTAAAPPPAPAAADVSAEG
jgi:hypothetical protein